ncbi:ATP-binding cassette sub-family A member 3 [Scaptodrosophila lebanonensis]|uniref:ATP-binding cassette sub-family A member 3 n=1 Tax=Drosophila lebanonensis TaxID=7225 RepID=A0A6J2UH37_DROLE|nr:ATP-binding cassette sub-family A member 3 [Scaptodrosophila lebanonensis]
MPAEFGVLFKRNWKMEISLWRRILFESIIIIIMLIVILVNPITHSKRMLYARNELSSDMGIVSHSLGDINILTSLVDSKREKTKFYLAYSPKTPFVKEVVEAVATKLQLNDTIGFDNAEALQNQFDERTTLAGIVFYDIENGEKAPKTLSVAIRFPSEFRTISSFLTEDRLWVTRCTGVVNPKRDNAKDDNVNQDIYIREGFLQLQHQIFVQWFHKIITDFPTSYPEPHVEVHNVRLKATEDTCSQVGVSSMPEFLINFLYLLPFLNIVQNIARQLEDNTMVHQWQYGYTFCKQWLAIFLVLFLRLLLLGLVIILFIFIFWCMEAGLSLKALGLMIIFIPFFTIGLILTAMVFAKLFPSPVNAVLFSIVIWVFNYAVFGIILQRYWDIRGFYVIFILLWFFNNQLEFSMHLFHRVMEVPEELRTSDYLILYISVLASVLIYLVLLIIIQWRSPGRLLSRRVLSNKPRKEREIDSHYLHFGRTPSWHNFEFGDVGSQEMMRLRHVSTTHRESERKILKNVSLRIYKGEVLVLLGHIGSGKITLLRVMAGLKFPIRGSVFLMGEDLHSHMGGKRNLVDFRCKENGLPPFLTVEQIIEYFVRVKLSPKSADRFDIEVRKWMDYLDPHIESRSTPIGDLKYGVRRLVSLCCALAGETKVLLLEEPATRLTGREAQAFWTIVMNEKEERAIVVATHSVDEAERIADRIAILSMGVLEASGTPFFLRAKFSSTIELVLIKKPHVPDQPITDFLQSFISDIEPENEIGDTLTYKIDLENRPRLQRMLIHLENDRKMLGIENVRVVGSEMSDIYMKLVTSFRLQQQIIPDVTQTFKYSVVSKKELRKQQMRAMFYKKMIHTAPNVWPIIMIFTSFLLIVIIARLAIVLDVPNVRSNTIKIGFTSAEETVDNIPNLNDCGYIDIRSMTKTLSFKKSNAVSRTFEKDSFVCEKGSYRDNLKDAHKANSLGAVEPSGDQKLNGYISQDTFHSAPMTLNLLHNIILRISYPNNTDIVYLVENHPMPTPLSMKINLLDNEIAHINAPLAIGCILPLAVSVFIIPLVEEQIYQLRILQVIAGIGLEIYWGINLFWDLFTFFIYSVIIVMIVAFAGIGGFGAYENFLLLLLMTVFGLAALPMTYLLSMYVNTSVVRAFLSSVLVQGLTGLVLYIIYWDVANSNVIFFYGASMSPGFSLLDGISNIYTQCMEEALCKAKCAAQEFCTPENMNEVVPHCQFDTYFKWADPGVLPALTFMILAALTALILIFWIELHRKEKMFHSSKDLHKMRTACYPYDDADVADVKMKIAEADMSKCKQSVFLVDQVEAKIPEKGTKINTVSFALNKYMSMGIFGPRNSGKSHLLRQLVGVDGFAFGEIYVRGLDFKYDLAKIQAYVGYCPQESGLLNELTPREHIRLLCMIRGVPEQKIGEKMHDLCLMLNMTGWMHRKVGVLTPEKRRKLNVALALVAYNKILVLDEPTRGMPSTTRREIWNILRYIRYCGKTIIFASCDELECKILADFILLFQDSEMLAIGSMQYLRYKYSHGFYLEVRLIRDGATVQESEANLRKDVENLARFVNFLHDKSEMVGRLHNWFKFYIPVGNIVYSFLYGAMEKNKTRLNVYDYCIYQASMSNVIAQVQDTRAELKRRQAGSNEDQPVSSSSRKK